MSLIGALWRSCAKEWSSLAIQSTRTFVRWDSPAVSYDHIHYHYLLHYHHLLQSLYYSPVSIQSTHLFLTQASLIKCLTLQVALETTSLFNLYYIMRLHFATQFLSLRTYSRLNTLVEPFLYQSQSRWVWHLTDETFRKVHLRRFVTTGKLWELKEQFNDIQCHQSPDIFGVNFSIIRKMTPSRCWISTQRSGSSSLGNVSGLVQIVRRQRNT